MRLWLWKMSAYRAVLLLKRLDFSHYNCQQLREVGCTAREIIDRGFTPKELKKAGFTVRELRLEGFSFAMLQEADFSFHELKEGGFKALTTTGGFSLKRLKEAGFTTRILHGEGKQFTELRLDHGFSDREWKDAGWSGWSASDLRRSHLLTEAVCERRVLQLKSWGEQASASKTLFLENSRPRSCERRVSRPKG